MTRKLVPIIFVLSTWHLVAPASFHLITVCFVLSIYMSLRKVWHFRELCSSFSGTNGNAERQQAFVSVCDMIKSPHASFLWDSLWKVGNEKLWDELNEHLVTGWDWELDPIFADSILDNLNPLQSSKQMA